MTKTAKKSNETGKRSSAGKQGRTPAAAAAGSAAVARRPTGKTSITSPQHTGQTPKRDQLAALLVRDEGATIAQMQEATGWLPHTVRAALTGLKKLGYTIDSDKIDSLRTYRAVAPE